MVIMYTHWSRFLPVSLSFLVGYWRFHQITPLEPTGDQKWHLVDDPPFFFPFPNRF